MSAATTPPRRVPLGFIVQHGLLGASRRLPFAAEVLRQGKNRGRFPFLHNHQGVVVADFDELRAWARETMTLIWIDWAALKWATANLHNLANYKPTKKEGV